MLSRDGNSVLDNRGVFKTSISLDSLDQEVYETFMQTNDYLFPHRLTRRDFLKMTGTATLAATIPALAGTVDKKADTVKIGEGKFIYESVPGWGALPEGMKYGFGCGVVVDSKDRVYVTSRSSNPCVAIFDKNGK